MKNDFEVYKLKNGMEVILVHRPESPSTTVMATVMVGSKYEYKEISGLSHFLEHMAFKGTKKRPKPEDISEELDSIGASYNALTGQEKTAYFAKARNKHFDQILDIVSDIYLNSTIPEKEMEKEKGVIIEEINMYEDMPMSKVQEDFLKVLYGDQPAGWPIAGRKKVVEKLSREDFIKFRKTHYKSRNTILTVSGGYPKKGLKEKIEKTFKSLEDQPETKMPDVVEEQKKPAELITFKKSDQAHFVLGFRAFNVHDKRRFTLEVLADILGGGMSSRLFKKIRGELGAAYYVYAENELDTNSGVITASAGTNINKIEEVIKVILKEFKRFKKELVPEKELKKSKEHITGRLFLALETSGQLGGFYTGQRVERMNISTAEEIAKKINKVTAEDIKSVAKELFVNKGLNLALVGPFKNRSFLDILKV
jgi:predicted Zn-dependent peptidase